MIFKKYKVKKIFKIREINKIEWLNLWDLVTDHNLPQSWEYAVAKTACNKWEYSHFLIEDKEQKPKAIVQILYRKWWFLGGIARINRGPLIIDKNLYTQEDNLLEIVSLIFSEAKKKRWWILFFAPNFKNSTQLKIKLKSIGLIFRKKIAWSSMRINLNQSEEELFNSLKSKWRNLLRKSLKSKIIIENCKNKELALNELIKFYETFQKEKNFSGISSNLINSLSKQNGDSWSFNLYKAKIKDNVNGDFLNIGMLVSITHGKTETYTIGVTNTLGRKYNANYLLLWNSILESKRKGCKWFDLGGLNKLTPKGVAHFKKGTNALPYDLIGESCFISVI